MAKVQPTKITELYNGKIKVAFYEKSHRYIINETERPVSVTACTGVIDKPALKFWAVNLTKEYLINFLEKNRSFTVDTLKDQIKEAGKQHTIKKEEAGTSGSKVHDWAEQYILYKLKRLKEKPEIPKEQAVRLGVMGFLKWVDQHQIKFLDTEKLIYSRKYKFVGLMDCKFTMGTEKHKIIHGGDFKTGKWSITKDKEGKITNESPYKEHRYQVSGYTSADIEESGEEYGTDWIIYFNKETGEFRAFELNEDDTRKKDFKVFLACLTIKQREKELKKS